MKMPTFCDSRRLAASDARHPFGKFSSRLAVWILAVVPFLLTISVLPAQAKKKKLPDRNPPNAEQMELVRKSIAREKATIQAIRKHSPLVETYIQKLKYDPVVKRVPDGDKFMLSRVDFAKVFIPNSYDAADEGGGLFKSSAKAISILTNLLHAGYSPAGFMDMMFIDPSGYDLQHYDFAYVGRQFLGNVRTDVFDVAPKRGEGAGRFIGRVWIEDQDGNIIRFNGTYTHGTRKLAGQIWVHFDSWRSNIQPGLWLPTAIYSEEDEKMDSSKLGFRAQTHLWGYSLKLPEQISDNTSVHIDDVINESQHTNDLSPLQAQRAWNEQAAQNVLDRLTEAGLLAPPSAFDKVLEQITNNIVIGAKLELSGNVHCRVLLTTPLETASVGNTILISKGLVDVLPTEADLAAMLSFQLAQIALGHQVDTRYAFQDRLLFPDEAAFQRISLNHSDADNLSAAKKAIELLNSSIYHDKLPEVALFLAEVQSKENDLKDLLTPTLGDSLLSADGTPWLAEVSKAKVEIKPADLAQIPALPLGSHLRVDPWDDKVTFLHTAPNLILAPSDKMPLLVTPVYFRLTRYQPPAAASAATVPNGSATTGNTPAGGDSPTP